MEQREDEYLKDDRVRGISPSPQPPSRESSAPPDEVRRLRLWAAAVVTGLSLTVIGFSYWAWSILSTAPVPQSDLGQLALLSLVGGTLGSTISCLLSACDRLSHGWEFTSGEKYPQEEPKDKFVARMIPLFLIRPLLGSVSGLLVFSGVVGGFLIATAGDNIQFSPPGILFLSLLAGLFAKTFLERLKQVFDSLFGKA